MSDKIEFAAETIAHLRGLAKGLESPVYGDKIRFWVDYYNGKAYLKIGEVNLANFTLGSHNEAEYMAEACNHLPAALDEIKRLTAELTEARELAADCAAAEQVQAERIAALEVERGELRAALTEIFNEDRLIEFVEQARLYPNEPVINLFDRVFPEAEEVLKEIE
jgi:hypothetical protein